MRKPRFLGRRPKPGDARQTALPLAAAFGVVTEPPQVFTYGPFGGKSEDPRTKRTKKAQRRARAARRKGEARA
jgi:hypothetical protein